ncbi:Uncharacterised protein [Chlamydia trachomatis]|nr:Uncharacterised protein [Chlamydia trachomatis]
MQYAALTSASCAPLYTLGKSHHTTPPDTQRGHITKNITANVSTSKMELMGPKQIINLPMDDAFHARGRAIISRSTPSHGMAVQERS